MAHARIGSINCTHQNRLFLREERKKGLSSWEGDMVSDIWTGWRRKQGLGIIMFRFINYKILKRIEKNRLFNRAFDILKMKGCYIFFYYNMYVFEFH